MQPYANYQAPVGFQYSPAYVQPQMQSPYAERLNQLQAMQQSLHPAQLQQGCVGLNGRVIDSFESVTASDVPMDGTFAIFPKRDMSEIAVKYWTGEGKIATTVFKPMLEANEVAIVASQDDLKYQELEDTLRGIYDKVDTLTLRLDEVLKVRNSSRTKKEVVADE